MLVQYYYPSSTNFVWVVIVMQYETQRAGINLQGKSSGINRAKFVAPRWTCGELKSQAVIVTAANEVLLYLHRAADKQLALHCGTSGEMCAYVSLCEPQRVVPRNKLLITLSVIW